jgi:hypothetical protein
MSPHRANDCWPLVFRMGAFQMVSLHRFIQEVLSGEEREQRTVLAVNALFPNGEHGT